jgi:acyl-CoA synthetase (AMP-forming)/AMP-acid ligase II
MSRDLLRAWEVTLRRRGGHTAVTQALDRRSCTFRELDDRAAAWLAAHSPSAGFSGGAAVFSAPNGIEWFVIFIGLLRAGATLVPLDAAEPPDAQRRVAEALRAGFLWDGTRLVPLARPRRRRQPVCLIKLTSGTKGNPRPLAFSGAQLLADAGQVTATMGIRPNDLNYALIPLGHSYGLGSLVIPLMAKGVPIVCGEAPLPHAIAEDFKRWSPSVFPCVPAVWRALAAAEVDPGSLRSLRLAISAGAPLPPEVARGFAARFGIPLHNFYGSSETGGISFDRSGGATLAGGVGRALRGVRIARLRGERIRVCSAAVFTRANPSIRGGCGCWIPPDRVTVGTRGELRLAGRRGSMVKIAGRRVSLSEIELCLRRLEGVREAWVQVGPGPNALLGAALAADRPAAELRAALAPAMAAWKIPKRWVVLPALPLTARGKVDTRGLYARLFG